MNQQITLQAAVDLVTRLRENPVTGLPVSEAFDMEIVNAVTGQDGCVSLRVYFGMKEDGSVVAILAGGDSSGNDLTGVLAEDGFRCPPACPTQSALYL